MSEKIEISTEYITLAQFLKFCGYAMTGGEAKELIVDGQVSLNGEICTMKGKKLYGGEKVSVGENSYEVAKKCI